MSFWRKKSLKQMSKQEWESLCDGCGLCCLNKIEDETTAEIKLTNIACKLFNNKTCRCQDYENRFAQVKDCLQLTPERISQFQWLPKTCAYRLLDEGKELPKWHPLISGNKNSVHKAGISVKEKTICETKVKISQYENYVIETIKIKRK